MSSLRFVFKVMALVSGFAGSGAFAEDAFDSKTKVDIQGVISRQLDAFEHQDAKRAETFASQAIKDRFPEPAKFFDMVKEHYAPLIHPKSTSFGEIASSPHGPLQKMTIVAADGTVWTAIYSFEQVNGEWHITGCGLAKDDNQQDI